MESNLQQLNIYTSYTNSAFSIYMIYENNKGEG